MVRVRECAAGTVTAESTRMAGTVFSTGGAGGTKAGTSRGVGMKVRAVIAPLNAASVLDMLS